MRRSHTTGEGLRVAPNEKTLQLARSDLPADWRATRVEVDGVDYAIGDLVSLGRLRVALILTPWQERSDTHAGWLRP